MSKKLENRVAVITGYTSGMALATAKLFVEEGAYVLVAGQPPRNARQSSHNNKGAMVDFEEFLDKISPLKTANKLGTILVQLPPSFTVSRLTA